jgi:hypothetical protein
MKFAGKYALKTRSFHRRSVSLLKRASAVAVEDSKNYSHKNEVSSLCADFGRQLVDLPTALSCV